MRRQGTLVRSRVVALRKRTFKRPLICVRAFVIFQLILIVELFPAVTTFPDFVFRVGVYVPDELIAAIECHVGCTAVPFANMR